MGTTTNMAGVALGMEMGLSRHNHAEWHFPRGIMFRDTHEQVGERLAHVIGDLELMVGGPKQMGVVPAD